MMSMLQNVITEEKNVFVAEFKIYLYHIIHSIFSQTLLDELLSEEVISVTVRVVLPSFFQNTDWF